MKKITMALILSFATAVFAAETTTTTTTTKKTTAKTEAPSDGLKLIKADELKKMNADASAPVYIFDANDNKTRAKEGVIPGALALTDTHKYDLAVLPASKAANVVFYCGGPMCMASHEAAKRAIQAGYTNVSVMSDGITGWKKAGYETNKFTN